MNYIHETERTGKNMKDATVKQEGGHYVMYIDGKFYGSYDTIIEAAKDLDMILKEKEEE